MKKGFTLMELLAVIVVLAIIALIAIPAVSGIITNTKKKSTSQSAVGYLEAVEQKRAINMLNEDESDNIEEGVYSLPLNQYKIKVRGVEPTKGWIEITKEGIGRYSLVIGEYTVSYDGENKTVVKGEHLVERPKVYPEYIYVHKQFSAFIGYPIDPNVDLGEKYVGNFLGFTLGFDTNAQCQAVAQYFGSLATCEKKRFYTNDLEYLLAPNPNWSSYVKIKVSSDGLIETASVCYKNGECVDSTMSSKSLEEAYSIITSKYPELSCSKADNHAACSIDDHFWIEINKERGSAAFNDYDANLTCGVYTSGLIGCLPLK